MSIKVRLNRDAVRKAIARRNMSQNGLAMRTGTSSGYISQMIRGVRNPSPKLRERIQDALAPLTFDDIFIIEESEDGSADQQT